MIHFNNHKPGFSFIEVMIAILLLAIFGTSLFITQAKIISTVSKTHSKVINAFLYTTSLPELITKKIDAKKQNKSLETISINKKITYPEATIQTSVKKLSEKSELFKDFGNYLTLVNQSITREEKTSHIVNFLFTPPIEKKEENTTKNTAKNNSVMPKGAE